MAREHLPNRRAAVHIKFIHRQTSGAEYTYHATLGYYDDGRLGEVFIEAAKIGSDLDIAVSDSAVAVSLALQNGCDVASLASAFLKDANGNPEGVLGTLFSMLKEKGTPDAPQVRPSGVVSHERQIPPSGASVQGNGGSPVDDTKGKG